MKVSELKRIIQPMIKDCIREVLLEEGMLSRIVKETAEGLQGVQVLKEQKKSEQLERQMLEERHEKSKEARKKLLDSIGSERFGGVDIFENTTPIPARDSEHSPLSGQDPNDAGVDISALPGMKNWGKLI
tara:strand:+ start:71 stop:460 length:390 start_codon:yes stop_codon:yes gene_type:complete